MPAYGTTLSSILAVGGGIVQDLATFAASVYMRGVATGGAKIGGSSTGG